MANIIRSAKSGSDWGGNELMGYNTTVTAVPPHQFFLQGANPICGDITKVADRCAPVGSAIGELACSAKEQNDLQLFRS